jgi:hypothetical protein
MFSKLSKFGKLQYTKSIWSALTKLRKSLECNIIGNKIPSYWSIQDAIKIAPSRVNFLYDQQSRIVYFFGRLQVTTVKHLWNVTLKKWKNFDQKLQRTRGIPEWICNAIKILLEDFHKPKGITDSVQADCKQWKWKTNKSKGIKIAANQVYHILLKSHPEIENLNRW